MLLWCSSCADDRDFVPLDWASDAAAERLCVDCGAAVLLEVVVVDVDEVRLSAA